MQKRRSSGVRGIDLLLKGGFPEGASILLIGPPGAGKTTFCRQFIAEGLKKREDAIYVLTGEPVRQAKTEISNLVEDELMKHIFFVDCYSWRLAKQDKHPMENSVMLDSLIELNELNRIIRERIRKMKKPYRIVLDSISDLLLYGNEKSVFRFLQLFNATAKMNNCIAVIVLEEGLHTTSVVSTIDYICDGTIEMRMENNIRKLRVLRMLDTKHPLKWVLFSLSEKGLELKVEEFFA